MAMKSAALEGLIAAPLTPMNEDGSLALGRIEAIAERLVADGVGGAFVCGTTGESLSLTVDERLKVTQRWMDVAGGKLRIIVHVGDLCLANACELARQAERGGAFAIGAMPPCFFRPAGVAGVVEWIKPVAAAAGETPFYYYHIPSMTGVGISLVELLERVDGKVPTFRGLKFTHNDLPEFASCMAAAGGAYDISFGRDESLLAALALGAKSAVGSTYNYSAPAYVKMMQAFAAGDLEGARMWSLRTVRAIDVLSRHGGLRCAKAIMAMVGVDVGPPRLPIERLGADEVRQVRQELEAIGFFEWIRR